MKSSSDSREVDRPLSQQIFEEIRRRIIIGEYPQGSSLPEPRISEELKTSRIPLREALPMLQRVGLIQMRPRRSSVVHRWTPQTVNDIFDVRLALEVAATGAAARRVGRGEGHLDLAEAVAEAERRLENQSDPLDQAESNRVIHSMLVASAGNQLMNELMETLSGRMTWLFYLTSSRDLAQQSCEHHAILDAVLAGNDPLAQALIYAHIEDGRAPTLKAVADRF